MTDTDDLSAAIRDFEAAIPGWWWSVCHCSLTRDASCGPDARVLGYSHPHVLALDGGFHEDGNGTLAMALRRVQSWGLAAIATVDAEPRPARWCEGWRMEAAGIDIAPLGKQDDYRAGREAYRRFLAEQSATQAAEPAEPLLDTARVERAAGGPPRAGNGGVVAETTVRGSVTGGGGMIRYLALPKPPRSGWQGDYVDQLTVQVIESQPSPHDTGILDQHGVRIYRVEDREPIGFVRAEGYAGAGVEG